MSEKLRHYEQVREISVIPQGVFKFADDHTNFSSHMNKSSWMMGGGKMETSMDDGHGQKVGSHIRMNGKVFGIELSLDEVIVLRNPPYLKVWETVGEPKLLVIGSYKMGFEISSLNQNSSIKVFIDYKLPSSPTSRVLGHMLGGAYAKWCVKQMADGVEEHFKKK